MIKSFVLTILSLLLLSGCTAKPNTDEPFNASKLGPIRVFEEPTPPPDILILPSATSPKYTPKDWSFLTASPTPKTVTPSFTRPVQQPQPKNYSKLNGIAYVTCDVGGYSDDADPESEGVVVSISFYDTKSNYVQFVGITYQATINIFTSGGTLILQKTVTLTGSNNVARIPFSEFIGRKLPSFSQATVDVRLPNSMNYTSKKTLVWAHS